MSNETPIPLGRSHLGGLRHVCAFFHGEQEAYRVLGPFIAEGFACGEKAIHILPPDREARHLRQLEAAGIDADAAIASGQLDLRYDADTYLVDGVFDQHRMLAAFEEMASDDTDEFPLSRIVCTMDWASAHPPHRDDLIEFEARVNAIWNRHDDVVICVYDLNKLSGDMVIDILRTHPIALIGNVLQENPFYTPPETFLRERRVARGGGSATS